jgi:hypothetical protein
MNERIKQLAIQAKLISAEYNGFDPTRLSMSQQKFAQLIVQECVTVMYDDAIERKVPPDINQTPTHYAVAVLEHFGVEE